MAEKRDIPGLLELAEASHLESRFGDIPFSVAKARAEGERAFADPARHGVFLAERGGKPVAFAYCSVGEYHVGTTALFTTIHNINVARDVRKSLVGGKAFLGLMKGIDSWSRARGSREILFHVTSGVDLARAHRLAKHCGFVFIGGSYARPL